MPTIKSLSLKAANIPLNRIVIGKVGKFEETFTDDGTNHVRKNEHTLYMESQKDILSKAKKVGFILEGHSNMVKCRYEYQYLYFLRKPN